MEERKIRKGQRVKVICTEARLKEVGVKQKHIKHILGKIGTVKEIRKLPNTEMRAWAKELGLTPAARQRMKAESAQGESGIDAELDGMIAHD